MFSFLQRYREPLIVGVLLIAPLISFLSNGHRGREPNFVDRSVLAISSPVQSVLTWGVDRVSGGVRGYIALRGAHDEAQVCRASLAEAHAEVNALREAEAENAKLRLMLGYTETTPEPEILAHVIGVNPTAQFHSVRINRGESDGVRVGMPVITAEGVVGQIVRTAGSSADVMLLTDAASRIGAVVQRTRQRATTTGAGDGKELSLDYVRREDDVREGDLIVTSGTDGVFPKGILVGAARAVRRPTIGMFLIGRVTPAVDLDRVEEVLVIPVTTRGSSVAERKEGK